VTTTATDLMTVSIVVPCFNYGRFLPEALASLDAQDRQPDEILICDDASTDDSWQVILAEAAKRPNVVAIRNQTNQGLIRTFNRLVEASSGEIIIPCSSDDRLGPTYVRRMVESMTEHDWDFAYSDWELFGSESGSFRAPDFDEALLVRNNYISGTSAFSRALFDRVGGYRQDFDSIGLEDWDFWLSAIEAGFSGGRAPGCHFEWRRHPGGSRNTISLRRRFELRWQLLRHHPRFFLSGRTIRYVWRLARGRTRVG
jgi:glycosyltransferase involved in cell wall biosynthesis